MHSHEWVNSEISRECVIKSRTTAARKEEDLRRFSGIYIDYHTLPACQGVFACFSELYLFAAYTTAGYYMPLLLILLQECLAARRCNCCWHSIGQDPAGWL